MFHTHYVNCLDKAESKGRVALLHAVSLVLEYSSFADARTFHNTALHKIEQERISWSSDFTLLADQFIDRQSLRSRGQIDLAIITRAMVKVAVV